MGKTQKWKADNGYKSGRNAADNDQNNNAWQNTPKRGKRTNRLHCQDLDLSNQGQRVQQKVNKV